MTLTNAQNTPEGETVDANGCSTTQTDSDGDGVTDEFRYLSRYYKWEKQ